jgi:hypothetical protein
MRRWTANAKLSNFILLSQVPNASCHAQASINLACLLLKIPAMESNAATTAEIRSEEQLEHLVTDIGRTIRAAELEKRPGLKELAETLLHEELATIACEAPGTQRMAERPRRMNPLAPGILLILLGLGLMLIIPLIGITLAGIGLILTVWGGVISGFRKTAA